MGPDKSATDFFVRSQPPGKDRLEGKYCRKQHPTEDGGASEIEVVPLRLFAGQYWWVEVDRGKSHGDWTRSSLEVVAWTKDGEHQAMSTEEIADALDDGARVTAFGGPFASRQEAELRMDLYWDAVIGHDD